MNKQIKTYKIHLGLKSFLEYMIALVIILDCNSVFNNFRETRGWFQYLLIATLGFSVLGLAIAQKRIPVKKFRKCCSVVLLWGIYLLLFWLLNSGSVFKILINLFASGSLLSVYFILYGDEKKQIGLMVKFRNIMVVLAAVSLFFWLFGSIFHVIPVTGIHISNWMGNLNETEVKSYFGVYYEMQHIHFLGRITIIRNVMVFNEAPMAAICLGIALMIEKLYLKNDGKVGEKILIVAMITTFSTSGYLVMLAVLLYCFLAKKPKNQVVYILKIFSIPVLFGVAIFLGIAVLVDKMDSLSGTIRMDDYVSGIRAWRMNPLVGDGMGSVKAMKAARPLWRQNSEGFSSAIIMILVQGGLYIASAYVLIFLHSIRNFMKRNRDMLMFLGLFLFFLVTTVVPYNYLTVAILCFMLSQAEAKSVQKLDWNLKNA